MVVTPVNYHVVKLVLLCKSRPTIYSYFYSILTKHLSNKGSFSSIGLGKLGIKGVNGDIAILFAVV